MYLPNRCLYPSGRRTICSVLEVPYLNAITPSVSLAQSQIYLPIIFKLKQEISFLICFKANQPCFESSIYRWEDFTCFYRTYLVSRASFHQKIKYFAWDYTLVSSQLSKSKSNLNTVAVLGGGRGATAPGPGLLLEKRGPAPFMK